MKTYPCNKGLRSHYDIFAFSPPVHTETMTIMKTQTKLDLFENVIQKLNNCVCVWNSINKRGLLNLVKSTVDLTNCIIDFGCNN